MSIFNKPPNDNKPLGERIPQRSEPTTMASLPQAEATPSIVAPGMKVIGDLESSGVVKIDGIVEGSIRGARQVLLGRSGTVQGDIHADEAVLAGKVIGTVVAAERVEVQSTCRIDGDIHTKSIVVLEGGIINGNVRMDDAANRGSLSSTTPQAGRGPLALSQ